MTYTFTSNIPFPNASALFPKDGVLTIDGTLQFKATIIVNTELPDAKVETLRGAVETKLSKLFPGVTVELSSKQ